MTLEEFEKVVTPETIDRMGKRLWWDWAVENSGHIKSDWDTAIVGNSDKESWRAEAKDALEEAFDVQPPKTYTVTFTEEQAYRVRELLSFAASADGHTGIAYEAYKAMNRVMG